MPVIATLFQDSASSEAADTIPSSCINQCGERIPVHFAYTLLGQDGKMLVQGKTARSYYHYTKPPQTEADACSTFLNSGICVWLP